MPLQFARCGWLPRGMSGFPASPPMRRLDSEQFSLAAWTYRPPQWQARRAAMREPPMSGLGRREFVALLGGAAAWPVTAWAERAPLPVIGYLSARTAEDSGEILAEFRRGLAATGFVEGRNLAIEYRWLE